MEEEPFCDHVPVKVLRDRKKEQQAHE
jgi:hypothetical protein